MRNKLTQHVPWSKAAITIGTALAIAMLTAFGARLADSKLDTTRFIADSITGHYENREIRRDIQDLRAVVLRVDSNTKAIRATHR